MFVPQDFANPLAVAIRGLYWCRPIVLSFYRDCELPESILARVKKRQQVGIPTIKTAHGGLQRMGTEAGLANDVWSLEEFVGLLLGWALEAA